jgi:hypothetical protein
MLDVMRSFILALATCVAVPALAAPVGETIPRFEAQVMNGGTTRALDSHHTARPTVYLFVGTRCPTTAAYIDRLRELEGRFGRKVDFIYLYPNKTDSAAEKRAFHERRKLAGGLVDDDGARIARTLGAQRTAEVFVVDASRRLVYHGAIDDDRSGRNITRRHLAVALEELLAGKRVSTPLTDVQA